MFDPYHRWLGIPPDQRPPTFYQLLGVSPDEADPEVIREAALRQTSHVRLYQTGPYAAQCTAILNEIGQARSVLLHPEKRKQYDAGLPRPATVELAPLAVGRRVDEEEEPALGPGAHSRERGGATAPALGFAAVVLAGAVLAFAAGLSRTSTRPEPAPTSSPPQERRRRLEGHQAAVRALAVASDGLSVLSAGGSHAAGTEGEAVGCVARLHDLRTGRVLRTFAAHQAPIHCLAVSPDGKRFLTGGGGYEWSEGEPTPSDCAIRLWDIESGLPLLTFSGHEAPVRGVTFLPDGRGVVSCGADGSVLRWDIRRPAEHKPLWPEPGPGECLALSPRGQYLLTGGHDGRVRLWDLAGRKEFARVAPSRSPVYAVAFAPDGKRIASGGGRLTWKDGKAVPLDCSVRVHDLASRKVEHELVGHTLPVRAVAWARGLIASGSLDGTVRLWDAGTGDEVRTLQAEGPVTCISLAPGKLLLAGTETGGIRVWDLDEEARKGKP
jgi:WD40 repeat protein